MKNYTFSTFSLFLLLLLGSCGGFFQKKTIEIAHKNFGKEVDVRQNLTFTFSEDMISVPMLNTWLDNDYIRFEPEVNGKFKWKSTKVLIFSPEQGFRPSTDYKAVFSEAVSAQSPTTLALKQDDRTFSFHTPYLDLLNADVFWAMGAQGKPEIRINMLFNYPVSPKEVGKAAQLNIGGKPVTYQINTPQAAKSIQLAVESSPEAKTHNQPIDLRLGKGFSLPGTDYKTPEDLTFQHTVPDKDQFRIVQAVAEYEGDEAFIHIYTNQAVGSEDIKRFVSLSPKVNFSAQKLDYGFLLKGDFAVGSTYNLEISDKLRGVFQGKLSKKFEQYILFGQVDPSISFAHRKALYLNRKGQKNIGVRIVSTPEIELTVYKIYKNNVLSFLRDNNKLYNHNYDEDYYYEGYDYTDYAQYGDVVVNKKLRAGDLKKAQGLSLINLDVSAENDFRGIYVVKLQSTESRYVQSSQVVAFSDIGLIAKHTADEVVVFANSILTAEPMQGAEITLVSSNNQFVATALTDVDGLARFPNLKKEAAGFHINMIAATKDKDFNYLHFAQTEVETARYPVEGVRYNDAGLQVFLYGDRNLYRPGETVHLRAIVRNNRWETAEKQAVKLKLLTPRGKTLSNRKGELNEEGTFETAIDLPAEAVTGTYMAEVYTANNVLLASREVSVEEFMPDRIKVSVEMDKETARPGDTFTLSGKAQNLFGPPAANRRYEIDMSVVRKHFAPKGLENYHFALFGHKNANLGGGLIEGETGEDGGFSKTFDIPKKEYQNNGILEVRAHTTVFDETGRPVSRLAVLQVPTQDAMFGIGTFDYYVKVRETVQIPLIAVNEKGQIFNKKQAKVELLRHEWQSVLEEDSNGKYRYISRQKEILLEARTLTLSGDASTFPFVPSESGEYEIRIKPEGAENYVRKYFYAYAWGSTRNSSFEVDKEGRISIETDKERYEAGETANLLFKAPFAGKMLVTIEREKILDHFILQTDKKTGTLSLPIKADYLPNVYISATLIKPSDKSEIPLTVAHGYKPLFVESPSHQLNLTIDAPEQSRSRTKHEVKIKTDGGAEVEVTVAVVDEGILQIKNYQSPDPYAFFFQKRALMVNSYDLYPRLFPELKSLASSFGAGMELAMANRQNPVPNKRVKLVSFWSGTLKTNRKGEVSYSFDVPEFSGNLRIMAVASKGKKFGSASKNMTVADPIVLSAGIPRFLSPGDLVKVNTTLTNTTDRTASLKVSLLTEGTVKPQGDRTQRIEVRPNSEKQITFALQADRTIGTGKIKIEADGLGETFVNTTEITVRPPTSLLKSSGAGLVKSGESLQLDLKKDYAKGTVKGKLLLSKSPMVQFANHLKYLVNYPHGCLEQTVSSAFPQIYFTEVTKSLGTSDGKNIHEPAKNVQAAIQKLYAMQAYDGAMFYWPGGSYTSWWGTIYAAHFLQEAQAAGYEVDDKVLEKAYTYLRAQLKSKQRKRYAFVNAAGVRKERTVVPREIFYALYVLANADKKQVSRMNYYKKRQEMMTLDSRYLLAATYMMIGDNNSYRQLLPNNFDNERAVNEFGGSFGSFIRDQALALNVLLETDPNNGQIGMLSKQLSEQLRLANYLNTQERAFAMLALGKLAKKANEAKITAKISADNKKVAKFDNAPLTLTEAVSGKQINIETEGEGNLYYFWELEGLSTTGEYVEQDNNLKVRKTFFDRNGKPIESNSFAQNDLIIAKITLSTLNNIPKIENVIVTDMLPGGLEIENPRISNIPGVSWIKNQSYPEHSDFRDDRVHFFTTATATPKSYYYILRAVTPGSYRMGPVSADAMYNGAYHSYHGANTITVTP